MKKRIDHRKVRKQVIEKDGLRLVLQFTEMPRNDYVYIHKKETDGEVFYVGRGKRSRFKSIERNEFWKNIVKKHGCLVEIVAQGLHTYEAKLLEMKLVNLYGRRDLGEGSLVNLTDGGDGGENIIVSQATRDKISAANTGKSNANSDPEPYHFRNYMTGETTYTTKWDFYANYSINPAGLFSTKAINTNKGWYAECRMTADQLTRLENRFTGIHSKKSDLRTYTFVNVDTTEEFTGNRHEFFEKFKTPVYHLFNKPSTHTNSTAHGWAIKDFFSDKDFATILQGKKVISDDGRKKLSTAVTGLNNPMADHTVYNFYNLLTDEIVSCTRYEMTQKVGKIEWLFQEGKLYVKDWCFLENKEKVLVPRGKGVRNGGKDYNRFRFTHKDGTEMLCTRVQFKEATGVNVKILFRSRTKTYRDWTVHLPE